MKALILSCSTGEGHNSAAKAVYEAMQNFGVNCELKDALSFGNKKVASVITKAFNDIAVKTPNIFSAMYKAGDFISNSKVKSPIYSANSLYAKALLRYISDNHFDIVICSHLFPMEALTFLKKKYYLNVRCYGVMTDYTCIPFLEETNMDYYFIPHKSLRREYISHKVPAKKLIASGIPVSHRFNNKIVKAEARRYLKLPLKNKIITIMTGGIGCGNVTAIVDNLLTKIDDETTIIIMVGKNKKLLNEVNEKYHKNSKILPITFTDKVAIYMDASDILLTKPGGLSSTEAAVKNVPLIHTMPIPGCETKNATFFQKNKMSYKGEDPTQVCNLAMKLLNDKKSQEVMIKNQKSTINDSASDDIVTFILKDVIK